KQSFRNLTALYLSLDEPHLALICGRRASELGRRESDDSSEENMELPLPILAPHSGLENEWSDLRLFQLGKLYFHLGEAARREGPSEDGAPYLKRSARAFSQACASYEEIPEPHLVEYALVLK